MKKNKGFTLAELLIVVAVIAVLVAISYPIFVRQIEKSREATDIANMRGAYAAISYAELSEEEIDGQPISYYTATHPLYYTLDGKLTSKKPTSYGEGTRIDGETIVNIDANHNYDTNTDYTDKVITCWFNDGVAYIYWSEGGTSSNPSTPTTPTNSYDGQTVKTAEIPSTIKSGEKFSVKTGSMYTYEGKKYVALSDAELNEWYAPTPDNASWLYLSPTSKVVTSSSTDSDGRITVALKAGDIYSDGSNLYIRKTDAEANQLVVPSKDSQNWQIITK